MSRYILILIETALRRYNFKTRVVVCQCKYQRKIWGLIGDRLNRFFAGGPGAIRAFLYKACRTAAGG